jgi:arabinan endo-1,5-alpha-L-arabinosidase
MRPEYPLQGRADMRISPFVPLALLALHACAGLDDDDVEGVPDEPAEVEDASQGEDLTEPPLETDDADDPAEADEDAPATLANVAQFHNPVASNCADPGVVKVAGANGPVFYVACTGTGFPLYKSTDLVHWTSAGHIFKPGHRPAWIGGSWWAPEIHHIGDHYVAYFTGESKSRNRKCIGAAHAPSPEGPWTDLGHPLVCDGHFGLIDPNVFTDAKGRHFLYYKIDGNAQHPKVKTIIYGQQLTANGLGFVGVRHKLLNNTLAWEGDVTEAPVVIQRGSFFYMFYSGATYCNATYGVGVARARSPLGPFHKRSAPILHSSAKFSGPGHNTFVRTGGHGYLVYAAWPGAHKCTDDGHRELLVDVVSWKGGWPKIGNGTPTTAAQPVP